MGEEEEKAETEKIRRSFAIIRSYPGLKTEERGKEAEEAKAEKTEKKEQFVLRPFIKSKNKKSKQVQQEIKSAKRENRT